MANHNRYKEMEQLLTVGLIADTIIFILYLIVSNAGIIWLKMVLTLVCIALAAGGLALLYMTQELLKRRSLWLSCGFFSVLACILVSLILAYPG